MKFVNIGFNNLLSDERIVAILNPDSAPAKRLIAESKDQGRVLDCTSGRRTRSVIITDSEHVILSAIQCETVAGRADGTNSSDCEEDDRE